MTDAQGPGTDVCGECGGPKEVSRRGSVKCRACDRAKRGRTYRLPLTVDETLWAALSARADAAGVSVYVMGRQVLKAALLAEHGASTSTGSNTGPPTADEVTTREAERVRPLSLTDAQLTRARKWLADTDRTLPAGITRRSELRVWLVEQGFKP